jgi:hypothetical protein
MLEAAEASLKALNKGDITEVKAMKRPPVGVILVIEAICIIKKVKPNKVSSSLKKNIYIFFIRIYMKNFKGFILYEILWISFKDSWRKAGRKT